MKKSKKKTYVRVVIIWYLNVRDENNCKHDDIQLLF